MSIYLSCAQYVLSCSNLQAHQGPRGTWLGPRMRLNIEMRCPLLHYPSPDDSMEAPERTPLEDLIPFTKVNWGSFRVLV